MKTKFTCTKLKLISIFGPGSDYSRLLFKLENYFSMTDKEREDATALLKAIKSKLEEGDPTITGFNIGMNSGETAGQTVMHSHIHLIPRRKGDTPNPRGGVRGVIPNKMDY